MTQIITIIRALGVYFVYWCFNYYSVAPRWAVATLIVGKYRLSIGA